MTLFLKKNLRHFGYQISRINAHDPLTSLGDLTADEQAIIRSAQPYTLTSPERLATVIEAVKYIVTHRIPGDIAECGVWRGGSMVAIARTLLALGETDRRLYLYDTFEGMPPPTDRDLDLTGRTAEEMLKEHAPRTGLWAFASLDDVKHNVLGTGYPVDKIIFVRGKVEETIPGTVLSSIALLRLDTDWYESTRHELNHLFPLLSQLGLLIVDDYGHWQGSRDATVKYLQTLPRPPLSTPGRLHGANRGKSMISTAARKI